MLYRFLGKAINEMEGGARLLDTVPTFNSCTKCVGNPGILHDRTPNWHPDPWTWMHG